MRETRPSGSEGGARFYPSFLPLSVRLSLARLERVAAERMPRCSEADMEGSGIPPGCSFGVGVAVLRLLPQA